MAEIKLIATDLTVISAGIRRNPENIRAVRARQEAWIRAMRCTGRNLVNAEKFRRGRV